MQVSFVIIISAMVVDVCQAKLVGLLDGVVGTDGVGQREKIEVFRIADGRGSDLGLDGLDDELPEDKPVNGGTVDPNAKSADQF